MDSAKSEGFLVALASAVEATGLTVDPAWPAPAESREKSAADAAPTETPTLDALAFLLAGWTSAPPPLAAATARASGSSEDQLADGQDLAAALAPGVAEAPSGPGTGSQPTSLAALPDSGQRAPVADHPPTDAAHRPVASVPRAQASDPAIQDWLSSASSASVPPAIAVPTAAASAAARPVDSRGGVSLLNDVDAVQVIDEPDALVPSDPSGASRPGAEAALKARPAPAEPSSPSAAPSADRPLAAAEPAASPMPASPPIGEVGPNAVAAPAAGATSSAASTAAAESSNPATPTLRAQLDQGLELATRWPGRAVRLVLQPDGLGAVSLRVSQGEGGLSVHLAVDNAATRDLIQTTWPQLSQSLEQRGLSVDQAVVQLTHNSALGADLGQQQARQPAPYLLVVGHRAGRPAVESPELEVGELTLSRVDYRV